MFSSAVYPVANHLPHMYLEWNLQSLSLCSWVCSGITRCTSSSLKPGHTLALLAWKTLRSLKMPPYEEVIHDMQVLTVPFPLLSFPFLPCSPV